METTIMAYDTNTADPTSPKASVPNLDSPLPLHLLNLREPFANASSAAYVNFQQDGPNTQRGPAWKSSSVTFRAASQPVEEKTTSTNGPRRSKNGCLTCKIRKKKCKENRPVCSDCKRLNKECIWVDYDSMTETEIRKLKQKVELDESTLKLRKRKLKSSTVFPTKKVKQEGEGQFFQDQKHHHHFLNPLAPPKTLLSPYLSLANHFVSSPSLTSLINALDAEIESNNSRSATPKESTDSHDSPPPLDLEFYKQLPDKNMDSPSTYLSFLRNLSNHHEEGKVTELDADGNEQKPVTTVSSELLPLPPLFENMVKTPSSLTQLSNYFHFSSPSPRANPSFIPDLNESESFLYNYYVNYLSQKMSIAQGEANAYQQVFLPLAQRDKGVMYGILAWAGFHLGGDWQKQGSKYVEMAIDHVSSAMTLMKENLNDSRDVILNKFATLLILCGAEICRGDVKNWSVYLSWGWKILCSYGGILNFNQSKEEHWLISNFAYHDLLASSTSERGTYFPSHVYYEIFNDSQGMSQGNLSPLMGISKKLYKHIGDINTLSYKSKKIFSLYYKKDSDINLDIDAGSTGDTGQSYGDVDIEYADAESETSNHAKMSKLLSSIIAKAKDLEKQIDEAKPDPKDLSILSDEELELQLTLFEAFQLSAKLFLKQSLMKFNPSCLESQVLSNDLTKCIDILLDTPVQASLVFPVFIAGIHCVTEHDRMLMKQRVDKFMRLYGPWNVVRTKTVMERVWEINPYGDQVVDWSAILKELDWDLNFA